MISRFVLLKCVSELTIIRLFRRPPQSAPPLAPSLSEEEYLRAEEQHVKCKKINNKKGTKNLEDTSIEQCHTFKRSALYEFSASGPEQSEPQPLSIISFIVVMQKSISGSSEAQSREKSLLIDMHNRFGSSIKIDTFEFNWFRDIKHFILHCASGNDAANVRYSLKNGAHYICCFFLPALA